MSLTVTTRASTEVSTADGTTETVDSYSTEQSVSIAFEPDSSDVAMELGGEATAIGDDTLASGDIDASLDGSGSVTTAYGSATFVAAAESADGETAFATADSYGFVSGLDFLVVITSDTQIVQQGPDQSLSIATSETTFYGVDFDSLSTDGFSDGGEDIMSMAETLASDDVTTDGSGDLSADDELDSASDLDSTSDSFDDWIDLDGNIALLDIDADVLGSDTLLLVEADVLTIEDTLSTVVADLFAGVG